MVDEPSPPDGRIRVKIICPLYPVVEVEAIQVSIPAWLGERTIISGQAPLLTAVKPGRVLIYRENGLIDSYLISRGVCEVRRNICVILAWGGVENKIPLSMIEHQLAEAEETAHSAKGVLQKEISDRIAFFKMLVQKLQEDNEKSDFVLKHDDQ